jgi:hypothetical protein
MWRITVPLLYDLGAESSCLFELYYDFIVNYHGMPITAALFFRSFVSPVTGQGTFVCTSLLAPSSHYPSRPPREDLAYFLSMKGVVVVSLVHMSWAEEYALHARSNDRNL